MHEHITVDGERLTLTSGQYAVIDVLASSGLPVPHRYDLIRLDADGQHVTTHYVGDMVTLAHGDEFITARISTTTA